MRARFLLIIIILVNSFAFGQAPQVQGQNPGAANNNAATQADKKRQENAKKFEQEREKRIFENKIEIQKKTIETELEGIEVRLKDIARFRGIRDNHLQGYGLVTGLEGTGDSKKSTFTATLLANLLKDFGTIVSAAGLDTKNVAAVAVTAKMPTTATPGNTLDVKVQSIGDAKSLQGGVLLRTRLYGPHNKECAMAVAQGSVSIGGFNVSGGGATSQKNHVNVGRIPGGATVERAVATEFAFEGNTLFLELQKADLTTAQRVANKLNEELSHYKAIPLDGGTVRVEFPAGTTAIKAMSTIELLKVKADIPAVVVINERTGTIVMGGNVRLGPSVIAHGSLSVRIQQDLVVSQPNPFSEGKTVTGTADEVGAAEEIAQIAVVRPTATVNDLAKIFQMLKLTPRDIIAILQALRQQGSLKARIEVQ